MLEGSHVAIVTPFKNGLVDEVRLRALIARQIEKGTHGIVPCGTTGESPTLSHEEHKRVIEITIAEAQGRMKVIAGAGSNSTREAIELAQFAEGAGADAILVITPYYNKPTQRGLLLHFEAIAKKVKIPIVLYNVPGRTGVNLEIDTLVSLSQIPGIVGLKEASGSVDRVSTIVARTTLEVLSGDDSLTFPMMMVGARGVISVSANVIPDLMAQMVSMTLKGDFKAGRALHQKLFELNSKLFLETNPIPVKAALSMMGLIEEELRLPLCPMSADKRKILETEMKKLGLV
jgi:4-hydroxy-tetrahydrodipicolinate synthase